MSAIKAYLIAYNLYALVSPHQPLPSPRAYTQQKQTNSIATINRAGRMELLPQSCHQRRSGRELPRVAVGGLGLATGLHADGGCPGGGPLLARLRPLARFDDSHASRVESLHPVGLHVGVSGLAGQ